jgi:mono/diheme cytochrome c family protein
MPQLAPPPPAQDKNKTTNKSLVALLIGVAVVIIAVAVGLVFFLKSQSGAATSVPTPSDPFIAKGQMLYNQNCLECHGEQARGDGPRAPTLKFKPADLVAHRGHHTDADFFSVIQNGTGFIMPGFKDKLSEEDTRQIIAYLRYLKE